MVLFTPIALACTAKTKPAPDSQIVANSQAPIRSSEDWMKVAIAIIVDLALILTLVITALAIPSVAQFWTETFPGFFAKAPQYGYPIAIGATAIICCLFSRRVSACLS